MSDLLQIGASGVRAYQTALTTIGENVSNSTTAGYTRRTVSLAQVQGTASSSIYYNNYSGFSGVTVDGIGRAGNDYQAAAARTAASDAGRASARVTWLSSAQTALNDGADGVGQSATALFNAGDSLASDPGSSSGRKAFLAAVDQTASAFRTTATGLATTSTTLATAAQTTVQAVNGSLDSLDKINAALRASVPGTAGNADLLDQRDKVLDDISANLGVDVAFGANGAATVSLSQSGTVLTSGTSNQATARLTLQNTADGRLLVSTVSNGQSQQIADPGGTLGGQVASATTIADRRNALDTMAASFATALNGWQAQGTDTTGTAGAPLLTGTTAATLTLATSDPNAVAAANASASNGNLLALSALRGSDGVEAQWNTAVTDQGQLVATATSESSAATARSTAATGARTDASGVDLDTEAAELLRYQQAYNASAKVIQTARETMQSILDLF